MVVTSGVTHPQNYGIYITYQNNRHLIPFCTLRSSLQWLAKRRDWGRSIFIVCFNVFVRLPFTFTLGRK